MDYDLLSRDPATSSDLQKLRVNMDNLGNEDSFQCILRLMSSEVLLPALAVCVHSSLQQFLESRLKYNSCLACSWWDERIKRACVGYSWRK